LGCIEEGKRETHGVQWQYKQYPLMVPQEREERIKEGKISQSQ